MVKGGAVKEKNYISILDGFLRAKIYLMAITVIWEINEMKLQLFLLMLGTILTGISIMCSMCINRKNWYYSWMISFVGCFFYLICYIVIGCLGKVIFPAKTLNIDSNPALGIFLLEYTKIFWGTVILIRSISILLNVVVNRWNKAKYVE